MMVLKLDDTSIASIDALTAALRENSADSETALRIARALEKIADTLARLGRS